MLALPCLPSNATSFTISFRIASNITNDRKRESSKKKKPANSPALLDEFTVIPSSWVY